MSCWSAGGSRSSERNPLLADVGEAVDLLKQEEAAWNARQRETACKQVESDMRALEADPLNEDLFNKLQASVGDAAAVRRKTINSISGPPSVFDSCAGEDYDHLQETIDKAQECLDTIRQQKLDDDRRKANEVVTDAAAALKNAKQEGKGDEEIGRLIGELRTAVEQTEGKSALDSSPKTNSRPDNSTVKSGSSTLPGGVLRVAEPITENPWESFFFHTITGVSYSVIFPFGGQLFYEFLNNRRHTTPHSYFLPVGLLAGCAVSCVVVTLRLCMGAVTRAVLEQEFGAVMNRATLGCFRRCCAGKERKGCRVLCRRAWVLCAYILCASIIAPLVAWGDRALWEAQVTQLYQGCHGVCYEEDAGSSLHDACKTSRMIRRERATEWPETPLYQDVGLNNVEVEDMKRTCERILETNETKYIDGLLVLNKTQAAFESKLRLEFQIGVLEVWGAPCAVVFAIMMFASRLALRTKIPALEGAKMELITSQLTVGLRASENYAFLFRYTYMLQYGSRPGQFWSVKALEAAVQCWRENPRAKQMQVHDAISKVASDDDMDDRLDDSDAWCQASKVSENCVAFVFAAGHALIPGLFRQSNFLGGHQEEFLSTPQLRPALLVNMFVEFFCMFYFFGKLVSIYHSHADKLQQTIAFNCLWRFPDEHPLRNVFRGSEEIDFEVASHTKELASVGAPANFLSDGYRASFGTLHGEKLFKEVHKLQEWFNMRRYIQIDKFDERISMELAMTVVLLTLIPKVCLIIWNSTLLDAHDSQLQPINIVTLWDTMFIMIFLFRALMVTLAFNDLYDRHRSQVDALLTHVKLEKMQKVREHNHQAASTAEHGNQQGETQQEQTATTFLSSRLAQAAGVGKEAGDQNQPDIRKSGTMTSVVSTVAGSADMFKALEADKEVEFIEMTKVAMEKFDAPSLFFGMKVDRQLITGFSSTAAIFFLPQLIAIFQDFAKDF